MNDKDSYKQSYIPQENTPISLKDHRKDLRKDPRKYFGKDPWKISENIPDKITEKILKRSLIVQRLMLQFIKIVSYNKSIYKFFKSIR